MFVFIELAPFAGQWCQKSAEGSEAQGWLAGCIDRRNDLCRFINCHQRSIFLPLGAAGEGEEAGQIKTGIFRGSQTQCVGATMWKRNCIVQGPSHLQDGVWDYIREKDKAALEEGAFMETFAGKAVETTVYVLSFLIILWEIYLNTCISCSFCQKSVMSLEGHEPDRKIWNRTQWFEIRCGKELQRNLDQI